MNPLETKRPPLLDKRIRLAVLIFILMIAAASFLAVSKSPKRPSFDGACDFGPTPTGQVGPGGIAPPGVDRHGNSCLVHRIAEPSTADPTKTNVSGETSSGTVNPFPADFPPACREAYMIPQELAATLKDDLRLRLPTAELPMRQNVRIELPTGLCDHKLICTNFLHLSKPDLIAVTDVVAFYPYRIGQITMIDAGFVIDPVTCQLNYTPAALKVMMVGFQKFHPQVPLVEHFLPVHLVINSMPETL